MNDATLTLSELRAAVELVAREFEPGVHGALTIEQVVSAWAAIERMACSAKLRAAARAEDVGLDAEGAVAEASGVTAQQARRQTRARKRAQKHKKTAAALDDGRLSTTQADAIAGAADVAPEAEDSLLELAATASAADLLAECDRVRRDALDADGTLATRQRAARSFESWTDSLGMLAGRFRLEPVAGAAMLAEMQRRADQLFRAQVRAKGDVDTFEQRMADALVAAVTTGADVTGGGKPRARTKTKLFLIADKAAVDRGRLLPGEKCETADGKPIPLAAIDEALMDPATEVYALVRDEYDLNKLISYTRYWPARVLDALVALGMVCEVPGCRSSRGLQKDHHHDFAKGGPTSFGNGKWKCSPHHLQKTKGLYDIWYDDNGVKRWDPIDRIPPDKRNQAPPGKRRAG